VLTPLFFLESQIGRLDPPAITHPEFYYGFFWVAIAWQIVYFMLWRDPLRFRPMLIPATLGKAGFAISAFVLCAQGRLAARNLVLPSIDLVFAALFIYAFATLGSHAAAQANAR